MPLFTPPEHIVYILDRLVENGYEAYLVGGCVRDAVMGRAANDWDIATSAYPEDVASLFERSLPTGARYGTVTVLVPKTHAGDGSTCLESDGHALTQPVAENVRYHTVEVTTFRADGEYRDGRRPVSVEFVSGLKDDLRRRDFTINAIAATVEGDLIDPFGGLEDINDRVIRCVGIPDARFKEDALRMFRAYRFSAELDFSIEPGTLSAIYSNAAAATQISAERIQTELEKTLMSRKPEIAGSMIKAGLLRGEFGIRNSEFGITASEDDGGNSEFGIRNSELLWREDGDNSEFGIRNSELLFRNGDSLGSLLSRIADLPAETVLRWCAFCAVLLDQGLIQSCAQLLRSLRLDTKTVKNCKAGIEITQEIIQISMASGWEPGGVTPQKSESSIQALDPEGEWSGTQNSEFRIPNSEFRIPVKRLLAKNGTDAVRCAAAAAEILYRVPAVALTDEIIISGECFSLKQLAISGRELIALGHKPGPDMKKTLNDLLYHVIERPMDNIREVLLSLVK